MATTAPRRARLVALMIGGFLLLPAAPARAAAGDPDPSFGGDGKVTTNFTSGSDQAVGVAIQADGKVVVVGGTNLLGQNATFALARYDTDGTLDPAFGIGGKVVTNISPGYDEAVGVAIQAADQKIVVAGVAGGRFGLARYETDGTLDSGFSGNGKVTTDLTPDFDYAYAVGIQSDGKIVAGGYAGGQGGRFALVRYATDGTVDTTFGGGDGTVFTDFTRRYDSIDDLAIGSSDEIVAVGTGNYFSSRAKFALARYDADGSLDSTFSGDGKVTTDPTLYFDGAFAVAIQSADQKVVVAGQASHRLAVFRYDTDGSLDATFGGGDGMVLTNFTPGVDYADEVAIQQADGKIVAAGATNYYGPDAMFALVRINTDGTPDSTFSGDGKVTTDFTAGRDGAWSMAIQSDGNIVASGYAGWKRAKFAVVRYLGA